MAKRHHISFTTIKGEAWTVEIHDADFTGTSTEVDGRFEGFGLDYQAQNLEGTADMFAPIMASSARFDMLIDAGNESLVTDMAASREKRFHLVIYRGGSLYWVGYIVIDGVRADDRYYPYNLSIFAIDGLSRLKEIEYKNPATGFKYHNRQTALGHFYNIIDILDLQGVVNMPVKTFRTNFNWFADGMATGSGNCPLTQFEIDHVVFQETDNEGNEIIWNCYEVLEALCRGLGGRFFFADGSYWFMQPGEYTTSTQTVWAFDDGMAQVGYNSGRNYDKAIDYSSGVRLKETGGSWTHLRPIKKVVVDYHHLSGNNRAEGITFSNSATGSLTSLPGVVTVDNNNETRLIANIKMKVRTNQLDIADLPDYNVYPPHRYKFLVTIKIGSYYLNNAITGTIYDLNETHIEWLSAANTIETFSPIITETTDNTDVYFDLNITTPALYPIMSGNPIQFHVELDSVIDIDGNEVTDEPIFATSWWRWNNHFNNIFLEEEGVGNAPSQDVKRYEVEDTTQGNTGIYPIDTFFGDGPLPFSLSRLTDGDGDKTEDWGVGASGNNSISMLLAKEVLNLRQTAAKVYQGVYLAADIHPYSRVVDLTEGYIPTRLSYSAFYDKWGGDFVKVAAGVFTPTTNGPWTPGTGNGPLTGKGPGVPSFPSSTPNGATFDPNNSLINNANNAISTTTTAQGIPTGTTNPTVNISAVGGSFVKQGDTIKLLDPSTGTTQNFNVAATPAPNATTLSLAGTASHSFPPGTFIQPVQSITGRGFVHMVRDFTGTLLNVPTTTGTLPNPSIIGENEALRRVRVFRGSTRIYFNNHTAGDYYADGFHLSGQRVTFYQKVRGETVFVEVIP